MKPIEQLLSIMEKLRNKETGCPWDKEQTPSSISKYTLEEAYEVYDAVERNDYSDLKSELGDLLFHVVFYSQMAKEHGKFDFDEVAQSSCDKMIHRHPHIFGTDKVPPNWEELKKAERAEKNETGILDGIAKALPATTRALKLQARAATVGFDWDNPLLVLNKISEEIEELKAEILAQNHEKQRLDEMGDVLFACVNLARKLNIDPETALRHTNQKFESRFNHIEKSLKAQNKDIKKTSLEEMERLWIEAKNIERQK
ncbi:MAG: nucleoside triphosphate pyrophosphohydrolase [Alphaproteobacteria bacterium]|nr:nucleoside triphosphate pyrophosphohydrolase [Alphaproteobacteria bacterium]